MARSPDRRCLFIVFVSNNAFAAQNIVRESFLFQKPRAADHSCATYVGYKQKGLVGAVAATVGIILPSFCIIFIISSFLDGFLEIAWIAHAFMGIKIAVGILISDAAVKMISKMPKKPLPLAIMGGAFCAMMLVNIFAVRVSSITLMLIAGILSLSIFLAKRNAGDGGRS